MSDRTVKTIAFGGVFRALIVPRDDGRYSYRMQTLLDVNGQMVWSPPGPYAGVYDSAETAEREAIAIRAARLN